MSPVTTSTVPLVVTRRLDRHPYGVAGAVLRLLDGQHGVGDQLLDVGADLLALVADHRHDALPARSRRTAVRT